jgi:hypothetical protein
MFASRDPNLNSPARVRRACAILLSIPLGLSALAFAAQAEPVCKPDLAVRKASFSPINYETMRRIWSGTLSVDASDCAIASGSFEILFVLWSETAMDDEVTHSFTWTPGLIDVNVELAAGGAIGGYEIRRIASCPCRK